LKIADAPSLAQGVRVPCMTVCFIARVITHYPCHASGMLDKNLDKSSESTNSGTAASQRNSGKPDPCRFNNALIKPSTGSDIS